jgi:APA family basic amino acid/polyamine antiporter
MDLFRKKPILENDESSGLGLNRCLNAFDLTLLGIGAIIGAGIFVLTGIAAATQAGPAIIFSYLLAGIACAFSALSYAELSASIGGCGSAYGYSYVGFGEFIAWLIGWDLLLEYGVICSTVAIGWSGYVNSLFTAMGMPLPYFLIHGPFTGGIINLPAIFVVLALTGLLALGIRESARINAIIVAIKLFAVALFIVVAMGKVNFANWHPFMPFGWKGIANGAALIFFAYIGFDALSTAAEETINPQRNLPIGIVASLAICTIIYIIVSGLLTGVVPYTSLNVSSPVADVMLRIHSNFAASVIAVGAIAGLTTVVLVMFYGLTRIVLAMARDGLLPSYFSRVDAKTQTPISTIVIAGVVIALIAGLAPIDKLAELANMGTLMAFSLVCGGVIVLRHTKPTLPRPFKVPFAPWTPLLGIIFCVYLMVHLSMLTWWAFVTWVSMGIVLYFIYGRKNSLLAPVTL